MSHASPHSKRPKLRSSTNSAPFRWDSFKDWGAAFGDYNTQSGVAPSKTTLLKFSHINVEGDRAYVVMTVACTYTEGGKARKENGTEAIALEKRADGWRIASFAWMSKAGVDEGADATAVIDAGAQPHDHDGHAIAPRRLRSSTNLRPITGRRETAHADWFAGLQKDAAQKHQTDFALTLAAPDQLSVNGDKAYAVFPTIITDKRHGKTESEHGEFAFALDKADGAWRITSWAWATK